MQMVCQQLLLSYIVANNNQQLLTSEEIKQMLRDKIKEKEKEVRPDLFNERYVQDIIIQLEILNSILTDINGKERKKENS